MATIRLIPSAYTRSSTNRVTVTDETNMYNNTDHTSNYASIRGRNSTSNTYYAFIHGFNFSDVPSNATVTNFSVKIRAYKNSYLATGSSYRLRLASSPSSSSAISNTTLSSDITTTSGGTVYTFPNGSLTWSQIVGYGSNFSIEVPLMATSSNYPYIYVYGAEIEVTYTIPNPRTITTSLTGNGTIDPSGSNTYYDGDEIDLIITPNNMSDTVTAVKDGVDITSQLVLQSGQTSDSTVLGTYTLVSGSFNGSGATYFQGLVGKGVNNTTTTSNYYSGGSSTIAVFTYDLSFNDIPSNATITRLYIEVNGHAESTSQSNEYMCAQLLNGSTAISDELNFKSIGTSNSTQTIEATTLPTADQLENLKLQCRLGYYGGAINGATAYIEYTVPPGYIYTFTVNGNTSIAVTIGGSSSVTLPIRVKQNGTWVTASKLFVKQNGSWVQSTTIKVKNNETWK